MTSTPDETTGQPRGGGLVALLRRNLLLVLLALALVVALVVTVVTVSGQHATLLAQREQVSALDQDLKDAQARNTTSVDDVVSESLGVDASRVSEDTTEITKDLHYHRPRLTA